MATFPTLLLPDEAREIVLQTVSPLATERLPHQKLLGRTLAQDIVSPFDLPPFDNSAMDGYALQAADLQEAPTELPMLETIGAGEVATQTVTPGSCLKIMTGAPLPTGADCVVMREETEILEGNRVRFLERAKTGQNIRRAGSDVARGEVVLKGGEKISAASWAMLASLGWSEAEVFQRPRVGILATGKELVALGTPLLPGQIYDSNSFALRALALETGAQIVEARRVGDEPVEVLAALQDLAPHCDLIVSSGGVSVGDFDPVRDILRDHATVQFWKIAMKPGKPLMLATFQNTPVFGLPGNPVSVMVAFEEFVRPAILKMSGRRALKRPQIEAQLVHDLKRSPGRTEFVRAHVWFENGRYRARVRGDQGSGRLSSTLGANALLVIDAEVATLQGGALVKANLISLPEVE